MNTLCGNIGLENPHHLYVAANGIKTVAQRREPVYL